MADPADLAAITTKHVRLTLPPLISDTLSVLFWGTFNHFKPGNPWRVVDFGEGGARSSSIGLMDLLAAGCGREGAQGNANKFDRDGWAVAGVNWLSLW